MNIFLVVILVAVLPLGWLIGSFLYVKHGKNEKIKQMLAGGLSDVAFAMLVYGEVFVLVIWYLEGF